MAYQHSEFVGKEDIHYSILVTERMHMLNAGISYV